MGSGQVLLYTCPTHRSLGCAPARLGGAQGQAWAAGAFSGGLFGAWVPGGRGASTADTSLHQPSSCLLLPSEPVLSPGTM